MCHIALNALASDEVSSMSPATISTPCAASPLAFWLEMFLVIPLTFHPLAWRRACTTALPCWPVEPTTAIVRVMIEQSILMISCDCNILRRWSSDDLYIFGRKRAQRQARIGISNFHATPYRCSAISSSGSGLVHDIRLAGWSDYMRAIMTNAYGAHACIYFDGTFNKRRPSYGLGCATRGPSREPSSIHVSSRYSPALDACTMTASWNLATMHRCGRPGYLRAGAAMYVDLLAKLCPDARGSYQTRQITN